jgi:Voltage gated chloride channel
MGAVFAGAARAPITAVIIIFELTGDYRIILPLMFAVVVTTAISNRITRVTIKLRRRGIRLGENRVVDVDAGADQWSNRHIHSPSRNHSNSYLPTSQTSNQTPSQSSTAKAGCWAS